MYLFGKLLIYISGNKFKIVLNFESILCSLGIIVIYLQCTHIGKHFTHNTYVESHSTNIKCETQLLLLKQKIMVNIKIN